ncbi:uncharacterized protein METZ01_LOCUS381857, partial [marine metagenome]
TAAELNLLDGVTSLSSGGASELDDLSDVHIDSDRG